MSQIAPHPMISEHLASTDTPIRVNGLGSEAGAFVLEYYPAAKKATVWYFTEEQLPTVDATPAGGRVSTYSGTDRKRVLAWMDKRIGNAIISQRVDLEGGAKGGTTRSSSSRFNVGLSIAMTLLLALVIVVLVRR